MTVIVSKIICDGKLDVGELLSLLSGDRLDLPPLENSVNKHTI